MGGSFDAGIPPLVLVGLLAGVLAAVGCALLVRGVFLGYPKAALPDGCLSAKEQAIVAACAEVLFPAGGPIPISGVDAGLVRYMDRVVGRVSGETRLMLRLMLHFTEHGPWLFGPRHIRLTRLRPEERRRALLAMSRSRIYLRRIAFLSLRTLLSMGYVAHDHVARAMGLVRSDPTRRSSRPPPRSERPSRPLLAEAHASGRSPPEGGA